MPSIECKFLSFLFHCIFSRFCLFSHHFLDWRFNINLHFYAFSLIPLLEPFLCYIMFYLSFIFQLFNVFPDLVLHAFLFFLISFKPFLINLFGQLLTFVFVCWYRDILLFWLLRHFVCWYRDTL